MPGEETKQKLRDLIKELSKEEQNLLAKVITAEQEKLHMSSPKGIEDDLERIVREVIK